MNPILHEYRETGPMHPMVKVCALAVYVWELTTMSYDILALTTGIGGYVITIAFLTLDVLAWLENRDVI